jgi:hypothetical protein
MGPRLFGPKSESAVRNKAVNVGQILGKMGEARNGLYILKYMQTPGLPIEQVFKPV